MKTRYIITFGFILTLFGCVQSTDKNVINKLVSARSVADTLTRLNVNVSDTSSQYIYDFMKIVIADQKLDLTYGLKIEPEQGCDLSQDDKIFLKTLLIERSKQKKDTGNWRNVTITINELNKCLTKADIDEMLLQKEKFKNFIWNNSRLGFNMSNDKNWYCFSRPLFTKDRKKAVMMIRNLCRGLCGTGWTVIFTNEDNKWSSKTCGQWVH